jgi:hypothetical protein
MGEPAVPERRNDGHELEKVPVLIVKKIRDAILDETFQPGERLPEAELAKIFEVSRSPVREALFALEKEAPSLRSLTKGPSSSHSLRTRPWILRNSGWASLLWQRNPPIVIFRPLTSILLTGSLSSLLAATAPGNTSIITGSFGTSSSKRRKGLFSGRYSGSWTTDRHVITRSYSGSSLIRRADRGNVRFSSNCIEKAKSMRHLGPSKRFISRSFTR